MHLLTWAKVWSCPLQHYAFQGCHSPHWSAPSDRLWQGFSTLALLFWTKSLGGGYHLGIVASSAASLVSTHSVLLAPSPCLTTKMSPGGNCLSEESLIQSLISRATPLRLIKHYPVRTDFCMLAFQFPSSMWVP